MRNGQGVDSLPAPANYPLHIHHYTLFKAPKPSGVRADEGAC